MGGERKRAKDKNGPVGAAPPDKDTPPLRPVGRETTEAPPLDPGWEQAFLEVMRTPVVPGDMDAAQVRVIEFQGLLMDIDVPDAAALFARLNRRGDVLAMTFKHTFATPTRRRLLARIESIAVHYEPPAPAPVAAAPPEHDLSGLWLLTAEDYEPAAKTSTVDMKVVGISRSHMDDVGSTTYYTIEFPEPKTAAEVAVFLYEDGKPPPFTALEAQGRQPATLWKVGGPDHWMGVAKHRADAKTFFAALRDEVQDSLLAQLESEDIKREDPDWFSQTTRDTVRTTNAPPVGADIKRRPDADLPVYVWRDGDVYYRYDTVAKNLQALKLEPSDNHIGKEIYNSWVISYIEQGLPIPQAMDQTVRDQREANLMMIGGFALALSTATSFGRPKELPLTPTLRPKGAKPPELPTKPPEIPTKAPEVPTKAPDAPTTKAPDAAEPAPAAKPKQGKQNKKPNEGEKPKQGEKPKVTRENYKPCFAAGTLVATPAGAVPIESLIAGDLVLARPADAPAFAPLVTAAISSTHAGNTRALVLMTAGDGALACTRKHPFRVPSRGWLEAEQLSTNDRLEGLEAEVAVDRIDHATVPLTATFNLTITEAATYFVLLGTDAVLVHNGDDKFNRVLFWFFGKSPSVDSKGPKPDVDGKSVWRTENRKQVNTLFETRVKEMKRSVSDPHGFLTPEQLEKAGVVAPSTPDPDSPLTKQGLDHHSVRPASNPDPKVPLTTDEMVDLEKRLTDLDPPTMKPSELHGECP